MDLPTLHFPCYASWKLDGVRAVIKDGQLLSRTLKPIPNQYAYKLFSCLEGYDGELIVGEPFAKDCYRKTVSAVMTREGCPQVQFYVFDRVDLEAPFFQRQESLRPFPRVTVLSQILVSSLPELLTLEQEALSAGYEGLIVRHPKGPYKQGRSTTREGIMLKLKRFSDAEFEVVDFEERMHNGNEALLDERGYTKRSSHADNKQGRGDLGALVVQTPAGILRVGSGFSDAERAEIWEARPHYLGRLAKVKYFAVGMKDLPRHPVFLGWRASQDY